MIRDSAIDRSSIVTPLVVERALEVLERVLAAVDVAMVVGATTSA